MTQYFLRMRLAGKKKYPIVLMLEPLHACNLRCSGCGRIREYASTAGERLPVEDCLASVLECGAPIVSICGGEPLIYPELPELIQKLIAADRHMYLCTNGVLLEEKLPLLEGIPAKVLRDRLFLNVHLDGMEATHDAMVERAGAFSKAIAGIRAAKAANFHVYTNTTVYRHTQPHELVVLFDYLSELGVDGMMLSPAYGYASVRREMSEDASGAESIFMNREQIHAFFQETRPLLRRFPLVASPIYLDFLCGKTELPCAAWANPTRNIRGWKAPCYLVTDGHYSRYREMVEATDWDSLGPGGDPRCRDCLVHCGFEPAAVLSSKRIGNLLRMALWQLT